jgi:hypothetical protein
MAQAPFLNSAVGHVAYRVLPAFAQVHPRGVVFGMVIYPLSFTPPKRGSRVHRLRLPAEANTCQRNSTILSPK